MTRLEEVQKENEALQDQLALLREIKALYEALDRLGQRHPAWYPPPGPWWNGPLYGTTTSATTGDEVVYATGWGK